MDFARLIHPHGVAEFFASYYEARHLVIARNAPGYYDGILSVDLLDRMLSHQYLNPAGLRIVKDGALVPAERWTHSHERMSGPFKAVVQTEKIFAFFHEGSTIVIENADKSISSLTEACRGFEQETHVRVQANIYLTPPSSQGFGRHYDDHDIFVLQVKGAKHWHLYDTGEELPLVSGAFTREARPLDAFELHAGDLLYLPRGVTHEAFSTDVSTIHVNFALKPPTGVDAIRSLAQFAEQDGFFRRAIPNRLANSEDRQAYAAQFAARLEALLAAHPLEKMLMQQERDFEAKQTLDLRGLVHTALGLEALTVGSVMRRWPGRTALVEKDDRGTTIDFAGVRVMIPAFVNPALLLAEEAFRVGAIQGMITDKGRIDLARSLARAGYLQLMEI
jgi:ribosomal protein L16 Arg81 hydroxylase